MDIVETITPFGRKPAAQRSRVTNGRTMFAQGGDNRSAWSRRRRDLYDLHLSDYGGPENMSEAELALCWTVAATRTELEKLEARMSEGDDTRLIWTCTLD